MCQWGVIFSMSYLYAVHVTCKIHFATLCLMKREIYNSVVDAPEVLRTSQKQPIFTCHCGIIEWK